MFLQKGDNEEETEEVEISNNIGNKYGYGDFIRLPKLIYVVQGFLFSSSKKPFAIIQHTTSSREKRK